LRPHGRALNELVLEAFHDLDFHLTLGHAQLCYTFHVEVVGLFASRAAIEVVVACIQALFGA